jgi:hypothetical protein
LGIKIWRSSAAGRNNGGLIECFSLAADGTGQKVTSLRLSVAYKIPGEHASGLKHECRGYQRQATTECVNTSV